MNDQFIGDVHDFVKYTVVRALAREYRVGVAWYYTQDPLKGNRAGHGVKRPFSSKAEWRPWSPEVFDSCVKWSNDRRITIADVERDLLSGVTTHSDSVPSLPRGAWFAGLKEKLRGVDIVFVDPDTGMEPRSGGGVAHVRWEELTGLLAQADVLVFWHSPRSTLDSFVMDIENRVKAATGQLPAIWFCRGVALVGIGETLEWWGGIINDLTPTAQKSTSTASHARLSLFLEN